MIPPWIWALGVAVIILGVAYGARNQINGYLGLNHGGDMLSVKGGRPTIWWYVDDSQVINMVATKRYSTDARIEVYLHEVLK